MGAGGLAAFGVPSPMLQSSDLSAAVEPSAASPFTRPVPSQMTYKAQAGSNAEERELDDNSLAWMAPDFDLDELL